MNDPEGILQDGPTKEEVSNDSGFFLLLFFLPLFLHPQVTAVLKLIARWWNTPGASCRST